MPDLISILKQAGFKGDGLRTAYAIAMRESGGRSAAFNPNRSTGDQSYGLFQINMLGNLGPSRRKQYGLASNEALYDPLTNARVAFRMSNGGTDFGAWGLGPNAYRSGAGFDTIKKWYDRFPQAGSQPVATPQSQPATTAGAQPAADRAAFFASKIKSGEWRIGKSSLAQTASLTREFNRTFASRPIISNPGFKYPKLTGEIETEPQAAMVQEAYKWLGTPYSWAGGGTAGPSYGVGRGAKTKGFDCSGLLQYLWGKRGVSIPRVTYDQWRTGSAVSADQLQPGDAVFFNPGPNGPEHVGMYIGDGKFIEAPRTGLTVRISNLASRKDFMGARRYG